MEIFNQLIESLIKLSPIIGILLFIIWYLERQLKNEKNKNIKLTDFIMRESIKNATMLESVSNTLDKVIEQTNHNYDNLKEWFTLKINQK